MLIVVHERLNDRIGAGVEEKFKIRSENPREERKEKKSRLPKKSVWQSKNIWSKPQTGSSR